MMQLFERFVVAIEKLAEAAMQAQAQMQLAETVETMPAAGIEIPPATPEANPAPEKNLDQKLSGEETVTITREEIREELDKLGAEYNVRLSTASLMKLLLAAREKAEKESGAQDIAPPAENPKVDTVPNPFTEEKPAEETPAEVKEEKPMNTVSTVREALKEYAAKNGKDAAFALLRSTAGGATKISDVLPAYYPAIIAACNQAIAA